MIKLVRLLFLILECYHCFCIELSTTLQLRLVTGVRVQSTCALMWMLPASQSSLSKLKSTFMLVDLTTWPIFQPHQLF